MAPPNGGFKAPRPFVLRPEDDIEVPVKEDWKDDPVDEDDLQDLPPELLESCVLRWTQQSRQPSADLAEKPPRGVDAVTARKIYRHHQRQTVEALDRLLNEVIDKSLFDLALEVLKKVRPDAAQWDSLSARMATGPQADELRAVFSSEGEGGTPKVVEMSGGDEDAEEDEAKKAEAKLAETASTKASAPSLGSAIPKKARDRKSVV